MVGCVFPSFFFFPFKSKCGWSCLMMHRQALRGWGWGSCGQTWPGAGDNSIWEVERHCPPWGSRLLIVRTHLFLVLITVLIGPERESVLCAGEHHVVQNTDLINRYRIELHKGSCRVQIDFPKFRQFLQGHDIEGPSQEDPCGRNKTEPTWKNRVA